MSESKRNNVVGIYVHFVAQIVHHLFNACLDNFDRTFEARTSEKELFDRPENIMKKHNIRVAVEDSTITDPLLPCFEERILLGMEAKAFVRGLTRAIAPHATALIAVGQSPRRAIVPV